MPQKTDWSYHSSELTIPEEMLKQTIAMKEVNLQYMELFDLNPGFGIGGKAFSLSSKDRDKIKPTWMGLDLVLTPNEAGDDWLLSVVVRSNLERPKVKKRAKSKLKVGIKLPELFPKPVPVPIPEERRR